ncbi:MAG: transglutaminase domain-containing protein [Anaerotignum sp.]|nr:transglutaminase domain-containing protein [Anaerotignum sp.]
MKNNLKKLLAAGMTAVFLLTGCGVQNTAEKQQTELAENEFPEEIYGDNYVVEEALAEDMVPLAGTPQYGTMKLPEASGTIVYGGNSKSKGVSIDASNTEFGYVMVKYGGSSNAKKKVIIQCPDGTKYTYNLNKKGAFESFVLSGGDGKYTIGVFENIEGTKYSTLFSQAINVKLANQFTPFLSSNQYVNFTADSNAVKKANELSAGMTDELAIVQAVYHYVVNNVTYDKQEAQAVQSGYLPDVDEVLVTKKGICFDYAALMAAMLRSQNIPTKLVVGYTGSAYHAWISTYTEKSGWVEGVIFFDGVSWKLMDPTFASSSNSSDAIMKYIGDGKNYTAKYLY